MMIGYATPTAFDDDAWILTATGRQFWPLTPRPQDIVIEDIAHALSMLCRFTGHSRRFYSVAEHCWRVSYACDAQDAFWGLLHDAAEAYIADVSRPLKYSAGFDQYRFVEENLQCLIFERFGLIGSPPASVKRADRSLLATERRDLMVPAGSRWQAEGEPLPAIIRPFSPAKAERLFLKRFRELSAMYVCGISEAVGVHGG